MASLRAELETVQQADEAVQAINFALREVDRKLQTMLATVETSQATMNAWQSLFVNVANQQALLSSPAWTGQENM